MSARPHPQATWTKGSHGVGHIDRHGDVFTLNTPEALTLDHARWLAPHDANAHFLITPGGHVDPQLTGPISSNEFYRLLGQAHSNAAPSWTRQDAPMWEPDGPRWSSVRESSLHDLWHVAPNYARENIRRDGLLSSSAMGEDLYGQMFPNPQDPHGAPLRANDMVWTFDNPRSAWDYAIPGNDIWRVDARGTDWHRRPITFNVARGEGVFVPGRIHPSRLTLMHPNFSDQDITRQPPTWAQNTPRPSGWDELGPPEGWDPYDEPQQAEPRWVEAMSKSADDEGWTNSHTREVADSMLNEERHVRRGEELAKRIRDGRATVNDFANWTNRTIIGPANRDALRDAQEWNSTPEDERPDHNYDDFVEKHPEGRDLADAFFGRDVADYTPDLIDPELVNWQELVDYFHRKNDANAEYEQRMQRGRDLGLGWAVNGGDERDKMRDAIYRFHGAVPEEDLGPGAKWDDPRAYHRRNVQLSYDDARAIPGVDWPERFISLDTRNAVWSARMRKFVAPYLERARQLSPGASEDEIEEMAYNLMRHHVPQSERDKDRYPMSDPEVKGLVYNDPGVQDLIQNGYPERLHDFADDLIRAVQNGQPHPYVPQMQQALQQRGYSPEDVGAIMQPKWRWDPGAEQMVRLNPPQVDKTTYDPTPDQAGDTTFPGEWLSRHDARAAAMEPDPQLNALLGPDSNAHVAIRVHPENLPYVLRNGVPNFFDYQAPGDDRDESYRRMRQQAESVFSQPPTYGYLATPDEHLTDNHVRGFGDTKLVLKPQVRDNTTFTYSDSVFGGMGSPGGPLPASVNHPTLDAVPERFRGDLRHLKQLHVNIGDERSTEPALPDYLVRMRDNAEHARRRGLEWADDSLHEYHSALDHWLRETEREGQWSPWPFSDFFEAQIHQPVTPHDIAAIVSPHPAAPEVAQLARQHGIPYIRFDHAPQEHLWESPNRLAGLAPHAEELLHYLKGDPGAAEAPGDPETADPSYDDPNPSTPDALPGGYAAYSRRMKGNVPPRRSRPQKG